MYTYRRPTGRDRRGTLSQSRVHPCTVRPPKRALDLDSGEVPWLDTIGTGPASGCTASARCEMSGVAVGQAIAGVAVIALSGWLFRLAVGLRPVAGALWVAPLPLLAFAPRASLPLAMCAAAGAWLVGQRGLWSYYRRGPKIPTL